jgi:multidrug efflux system outer membrane protein
LTDLHAVATCVCVVAVSVPGLALGRTEPGPPYVALPAAYFAQTAGATLPPEALDHWWTLFNDQSLDALEDEAFRAAPDARTAAARLLEARATRAAQTAATLPSGAITGNAGHQKAYELGGEDHNLNPVSGVTDTVSGNFTVSWELDLFGRLAVARRVANADAARARFNIEGSYASLAAAVADGYFETRGLKIRFEDARESARIADDLLSIARRRADAGAGPLDAVDRVAGQLAQARAQAADFEAQLAASRRRLLILVGRDLSTIDDLALPGDLPNVPPTPAAMPSELLNRRPDVREAEYRLRAQLGAARLSHLAVFPKITLLPGLGLASTSAPGVSFIPPSTLVTSQQVTTTGFWSLAAGVTAPTFDIPRLLQQARAEDARSREAAIAYEQVVRGAFGEAQTALTDLAAGEQATLLLTDGEERSRRGYLGARRRYERGLDDLTSALSAEQAWRAVRSDLTAERVETLRRAVRTYKALGGGWTPVGNRGA